VPLTFPSHAAAVVPLWRAFPARLWPFPLVIGSAVPDAGYAIGWGGHLSHRWDTFLFFCVPVGLFFWFWAETLLLPALRRSVGEWRGLRPGRLLQTRGLPRDLRGWALGALAIALGAATHVLWDGFTHRTQWPASRLYPDAHLWAFGRAWYAANLLQYASSALGLWVMVAVARNAYRRLPAVEPGRWSRLCGLVGATVACAALVLALERHHFRGMNPTGVLWFGFWKVTGVALVVFTAGAAWLTRRRPEAR
jgi:hypothetical protein